MTFSRNFQLGAMVVCVAALAGIYINSRGHFGFDHGEDGSTALTSTTPTPSTSASPVELQPTAAMFPAGQSPLPKSRPEILAALQSRGFTLEPVALSTPVEGVSAYRTKGVHAGVGFREGGGKLLSVEVMTLADKSEKNGELIVGFASTVGELATGLPREVVRRVVAQTVADVGKEPRGLYRTIDTATKGFRVDVTRHDDGGYSFVFTVEPAAN